MPSLCLSIALHSFALLVVTNNTFFTLSMDEGWGGQCLMNDSSSDMATLVMYLAKLTVWSSGRRMHSHVYNCWCYLLGFLLFRLTTSQITPTCRPCAESLQSSFFTLVLSILKLFCLSIAFLVGHCFFSFRIAFGLQYQLNDFVLTF